MSDPGSQNEKEDTVAVQKNEPAVPAQQNFNLQLDTGNVYLKFRQKWWQLWSSHPSHLLVACALILVMLLSGSLKIHLHLHLPRWRTRK
jgi:hypothetical protein